MERELSAKEKAELMGIDVRTLYRKAKRGEVQFKRYGRMFRFFRNDPPQQAPKTLIIEAPMCFSLKIFDEMNLKGGKMSKSKKRWNYGKRGVFLRELPNGKEYWYYWLTDGHGKRIIKSAKGANSRLEAVLVMEHAHKEEFKKTYHPGGQEIEEITFSEFADEYLRLVKNTKKSWKGDESVLNCGILKKFGKMKLSAIQPKHVEDYINEKLENVDRGTTNLHASLLRRMINKAKQRGYRVPDTNPVIHSEHIKKVDARDCTLTFEEEARLLKHSPEKLKPIIITALHTGMRKKEILKLEWKDVDLDYGKIHIRAEKSKTHQDRHIPIDNALNSVLETLHRNNGHSPYVFNKDESSPYADIQEAFAKARSEAGIEDFHFHDLRHTFATRAVKAGVDLFSLMKFLGHSDVTTTQRYVNLRDVDLLPAIEKLERFCERSRKMSQKCIQPEKTTEVPSYAM